MQLSQMARLSQVAEKNWKIFHLTTGCHRSLQMCSAVWTSLKGTVVKLILCTVNRKAWVKRYHCLKRWSYFHFRTATFEPQWKSGRGKYTRFRNLLLCIPFDVLSKDAVLSMQFCAVWHEWPSVFCFVWHKIKTGPGWKSDCELNLKESQPQFICSYHKHQEQII